MKILKAAGTFSIIFAAVSVTRLQAQTTPSLATQQQQNFQQTMESQQPLIGLHPGTNAPEIYQGENADIGEQHILRIIPRRNMFLASLSSQYLYINNALLTQHPYVSSTEFVNTLLLAFAPTPYRIGPGRLAPEVGYTGQWFDYGLGGNIKNTQITPPTPLSDIDFNVQSAFAGAKYYFPNNWIAFGQFNYNWFFQQNNSTMFYREFVPGAGLEHLTQVADDAVFAVSASGDWHQSWQINTPYYQQNRADALLSISFAWQIIPSKLVVQPYYRFQYTYYPTDTSGGSVRHDFLNSYGVSTAWFFTPDLSIRAFINDDAKQIESDNLAPEYHDWNAGLDLSYNIRF